MERRVIHRDQSINWSNCDKIIGNVTVKDTGLIEESTAEMHVGNYFTF